MSGGDEGRAPEPAGVVFDLDGTLIASAPAIRAVANAYLAEAGLGPPLSEEETIAFVGGGSPVFVEKMLASRGLPRPEDFAARYAAFQLHYRNADPSLNVPYAGAEAAMDALAAAGHGLALCTNKPGAPTAKVLAALGWEDRFARVVAGDTLAVKKPDPAPLLYAAEAVARPFVYVGDSEVDAETARRAGVPFLLHTEGYRHADLADLPHAAVFSDWSELPRRVAEVLGAPALPRP